jgi:hypothetical protein
MPQTDSLTASNTPTDSIITQQQPVQEKKTSNILLSKERKTPLTATTIMRGIMGMLVLLAIGFLVSTDRKNIPWKTVAIGLLLQVLLAIGILYIPFLQSAFEFFGKLFVKVLDFTKAGSEFLLGNLLDSKTYGYIFLFQVLPTIIFFSALTSLLFYWGIIQKNRLGAWPGYLPKLFKTFRSRIAVGCRQHFSGADRSPTDDQGLYSTDEQLGNPSGHDRRYGNISRRCFGCLHCHAGWRRSAAPA